MSHPQPIAACPHCNSANIQRIGADGYFCLDCEWDNLSFVTGDNDSLISALRHGDVNARREAVQALINIGDSERDLATSEDLAPLLEALNDNEDDVRYFSTVALGKLGDSAALPKLKEVEQHDSSELVRQGAKTAIERLQA
ncbi:MAG: HEAT repeat domain-containing protein [Candidatus Poribacteria bacterium]|nr:HEAT repeat domain-containing protein [Candidatus Poribacteria bacterium]